MNKNFYITTPIYYPSAKPHMGHAYSSIVADFFARFKKIQGFKVFFLTGTDEHGQKIQRAAEKKGMDPLIFCNEISKTFRDLSKTLNLSNTDFIRTTESRHAKSVARLWNILEKKDDFMKSYIFNFIEIYFLKIFLQSIDKNNIINFYSKFIRKINDTNKFNLDQDSLFMELKSKILNG